MICSGMMVKGNVRNVGSEYREDYSTDFEALTVTLIGKGRYKLTCFVYEMCDIYSKILLLSRHFKWEGRGVVLH